MAASDPAAALAHWRAVRERLFREHPQSPVPAAARADFRALHFDHDPLLRFHAVVEPARRRNPAPCRWSCPTAALTARRSAGSAASGCRLPQGERTLSVFWMAGYAGGIFIPFRDATNGDTTYGAGRYLVDGAKGRRPRRGSRPGAVELGAHPRLQFRGPAVVRLRSAVGVSARATREPARPRDPGGRLLLIVARRADRHRGTTPPAASRRAERRYRAATGPPTRRPSDSQRGA